MKKQSAWIFTLLLTAFLILSAQASAAEPASVPDYASYSEDRFALTQETDYGFCIVRTYEAPFTEATYDSLQDVLLGYAEQFLRHPGLTFDGSHTAEFGRFGEYTQDAFWFSFNEPSGLTAFTMNLVDTTVDGCHILLAFKEYEDKFGLDMYISSGIELTEYVSDEFIIPDFSAYSGSLILRTEEIDGNTAYLVPFGTFSDLLYSYIDLLQAEYGFSSLSNGTVGDVTYLWFEEHTSIPSMPFSDFGLDGSGCFLFSFSGVTDGLNVLLYPSDGIAIADTGERYAPAVMVPLPVVESADGQSDIASSVSSADSVLVAEAMDASDFGYTYTADTAFMQDLVTYCCDRLSYDKISNTNNYMVRDYQGGKEDYQLVKDYVNMLVETNPYLELQHVHEKEYDDVFFSFAIDYTGNVNMGPKIEQTYTDNQCNIMLYGSIHRSKLELSVWTPANMELTDLGLRWEGGQADVSFGGPSASAGLYRNADGSFETTDGRFRVAPGEAMILRDGEVFTTEATYNRNDKTDRDLIWMRYFHQEETLHLSYPAHSLHSGDLLWLRDVNRENSWLLKDGGVFEAEKDFTSSRWDGPFLGANHAGSWITPVNAPSSSFTDAAVRVMYMDGDVAVFYLYAEYTTAPFTMEALCAVPLVDRLTEDEIDYTTSVGQALNLSYEWTEFGASFNQYSWEIISGSDLATLSDTQSKTCTLHAGKPGLVGVRVTYNYGTTEPNVLTGNPSHVSRTKTHDYIIKIK